MSHRASVEELREMRERVLVVASVLRDLEDHLTGGLISSYLLPARQKIYNLVEEIDGSIYWREAEAERDSQPGFPPDPPTAIYVGPESSTALNTD